MIPQARKRNSKELNPRREKLGESFPLTARIGTNRTPNFLMAGIYSLLSQRFSVNPVVPRQYSSVNSKKNRVERVRGLWKHFPGKDALNGPQNQL